MTANLKTVNIGIFSAGFTYYVFVSGVVRNSTTKTMREFYLNVLIEIYVVIFYWFFSFWSENVSEANILAKITCKIPISAIFA